MKRILLCLALVSCPAMADLLPEFPKNSTFLDCKTKWENNKPAKAWCRWLDSKNNILCFWIPIGQELGALPTEWTPVEVIAANMAAKGLVTVGLTDEQKKDCTSKISNAWLDQIANLPPAPTPVPPTPVPSWKVAPNGVFLDRPMKDINFVDLKVRAKVGDPCEPEIIKTLNTKQSWHFTKSTTGVRGLAVCEIK
jgi:hypothetical protein